MAEFDPLAYNYELINQDDGVFHFQKIIVKNDCVFTDIIELAYWSRQKIWVIFVEACNLKQFLPEGLDISENKISLFVGELRNDFDYQLITKRMAKDPKLIIQLGS